MRLARILNLATLATLIGPSVDLTAALPPVTAPATNGAPWNTALIPAWKPCDPGPEIPEPGGPKPGAIEHRENLLQVALDSSGVLRVVDGLGRIRLRTGLPGRPLRLWRDAGAALSAADAPFAFPAETPLSTGRNVGPDFRPNLEGLLWILDDGGRYLTIVHPATSRVAYLPLPDSSIKGQVEPKWYSDHLEIREISSEAASLRNTGCWSIPWMGLLPQILQLATPPPEPPPGTALLPFPKE